MSLSWRRTVIGLERHDNDFTVYFEGLSVGRIRLAANHVEHTEEWVWNIDPPLPAPDWANGSDPTIDEAKAAFRALGNDFTRR